MKKLISLIVVFSMLSTSFILSAASVNAADSASASTSGSPPDYNFAKALQMSLYFYDAERCGPGISGGRLEWRGDCHVEDKKVPLIPKGKDSKGTNMSQKFIDANKEILDPDGDGTLDLSGGYHDAGDHVKFGLPQAYAASTLEWGFYEFRDAYKKTGQEQHAIEILRGFTDYFLKCTFRDSNGDIAAFCYQVGEGDIDHCYWGAPEMQTDPRPAYFATAETPASDICGDTAAALAISYLNFKDTDPEYAKECLDVAKAMYRFAVKNRGLGYSGGFYGSAYDEDELSWAAVWLNIATGDKDYINDIISEKDGACTGYLKKIINVPGDGWNNIWVHCWDVVWGGVFAKLAPITNTERDWYFFRWNCEYWASITHQHLPSDTTFLPQSPGGFKVVNGYGSARYNTAAQLCCLVYTKYKGNMEFAKWAKGQMEYIMGNNPKHNCYIVGYSDNSSKHPHHRAAHGSTTNSMTDPENHRHTLWGALVGGPGLSDDYNDLTTDYVYNEVSIDYNAGFVGALAGLYTYFGEGQEPLKNFPPKEPKTMDYYTEAKVDRENSERTQVTVNTTAKDMRPPKVTDNIRIRYYFNISELASYNQSIKDISAAIMYDEQKPYDSKGVTIVGPVKWDEGGDYYYEFRYNSGFLGDRELQFAIATAGDSNFKPHWKPANDYSREGLTSEYIQSKRVPMYIGDTLVFGEEPPKVDTPIVQTTSNPAIKVLNLCGNTKAEDASITQSFKIVNTGDTPINYKDIKFRYWFTSDGSLEQTASCDYAHIGEGNITLTCKNSKDSTGDGYLEIGFKDGIGSLGPDSDSGEIGIRISRPDYLNYNQSNDYSFNPKLLDFKENPKVTAYLNGKLMYGSEPDKITVQGDLDGDGSIKMIDLLMLKKYVLHKSTLSDSALKNADMNADGKVNSLDYMLLLKYFKENIQI